MSKEVTLTCVTLLELPRPSISGSVHLLELRRKLILGVFCRSDLFEQLVCCGLFAIVQTTRFGCCQFQRINCPNQLYLSTRNISKLSTQFRSDRAQYAICFALNNYIRVNVPHGIDTPAGTPLYRCTLRAMWYRADFLILL